MWYFREFVLVGVPKKTVINEVEACGVDEMVVGVK